MQWCKTVRERMLFEGFANPAGGRLDWSVLRGGRPPAKRMLRRPFAGWMRSTEPIETKVKS